MDDVQNLVVYSKNWSATPAHVGACIGTAKFTVPVSLDEHLERPFKHRWCFKFCTFSAVPIRAPTCAGLALQFLDIYTLLWVWFGGIALFHSSVIMHSFLNKFRFWKIPAPLYMFIYYLYLFSFLYFILQGWPVQLCKTAFQRRPAV